MSEPLAPEADTPLALARRVDQVCDRFEAAWKAAGRADARPRIEDFLGGAPDQEQAALLQELIPLDVYYRRRCGEDPLPRDYADRFPGLDRERLAGALPAGGSAERGAGVPEGGGLGRVPVIGAAARHR